VTSSYTFTVPVVPRGKGVVRHDPRRAGFFTFKDKDTENYMAAIATCAAPVLGGVLLDGPLRIDVVAVFPRTKELLRLHGRGPNKGLHVHGVRRSWAPRKPDKDNIEKALYDALKPWLPDDCKVVCGDTLKVYCAIGEAPHLEVRISAAPSVQDYFDDHGLPLPYSSPDNAGKAQDEELDWLQKEQALWDSRPGSPTARITGIDCSSIAAMADWKHWRLIREDGSTDWSIQPIAHRPHRRQP